MMAKLPFKMHHICSATIFKFKPLKCSFKNNRKLLMRTQTQCYSDDPNNSTEDSNRTSYLEKRRKAFFGRRRQLSPLGRVSGMIEQDKEDEILCKQKQDVDCINDGSRQSRSFNEEKIFNEGSIHKKKHEDQTARKDSRYLVHSANKQRMILIDGEFVYVVMENIKANVHLKEMFLLQAGRKFQCRFGSLSHTEIVGHQPGKVFLTDRGIPVLVRRPTLEEYVLHMKRTATISYPKDCYAMLMMIDASPGDVILEAGTGSGAMTLHLSRAVWVAGTIHTFEANSSHQKGAKNNIQAWKRSYSISYSDRPWPDNIHFHLGNLQDTTLDNDSVDGAIIDLEDPHLVIQTVSEKLKRGRAASIYVSNLSQVVDVTEMIRIKRLPLLVDSIIDVTHKHWLVHPARRRQSTSPLDRLKVQRGLDISVEESDAKNHALRGKEMEGYIIDHIPKYITRPRHNQPSFTAFLVKLTKVVLSDLTHKI